jgi:hypothetical protein
MCSQCNELDRKISYCQSLFTQRMDELSREGINMLIDSYSLEKTTLHLPGKEPSFRPERAE